MSKYPSDLKFSMTTSDNRLKKAYHHLGYSVVNRIIGYTLFLFGAKREDIAEYLNMPIGTFLSFLTRINRVGIMALEDRRINLSIETLTPESPLKISLEAIGQNILINLGGSKGQSITIPKKNSLQCKVILLSFLKNGLLSAQEVSEALNLSKRHIKDLGEKMHAQDVNCLIDRRKGQIKDYRFTPDVKSELIQHVVANTITGRPTSSRAISEQISDQCNLNLSDRSIRLQMKKMGLPAITKSLPELVETLKKTPVYNSGEVD